ncbi:PadR family transcriptional regulator [Cellulomonas sp. Leaf334]|uniref:PadR family transcriptional regulator n=1 Tax=Cellulomonas sp. Leaf334 TaxID=1736339 RepID=UPI0006F63A8D|nr:PadR family transcriptional regulator [Cellulomonas sp. Leaf334]KQR10287.1 PadR family transcriptional regulator [Cellulomonas sp. Leaf334]
MSTDPWPSEWLRGVLDVCVLAVLAEGATYGYAISARLDEVGLGAVKGGTLYPLLVRLEQADLVTTQWRPGVGGPGRKYFALTPAGRAELARRGSAWRAFAGLTVGIIDPAAPPVAATPAAPPASDRLPTPRRTAR